MNHPERVTCPGGCGLRLMPEYENHVCPGPPPASLTGVMQAPVATNLDPDTEGI